MKEPDHKVKRHFVPFSNKEKPHWVGYPVHGWLASGIVDRNGKEIFEGDLVRIADGVPVPAFFTDGAFWLGNGFALLVNFKQRDLEVVGHIAEEQS